MALAGEETAVTLSRVVCGSQGQLLTVSRMPRNGEGACSLWSKPLGSGSELSTPCEASSFHGPSSVVLQTDYLF